jgi:formylglycine-generating enzyme required for sulfatase activity
MEENTKIPGLVGCVILAVALCFAVSAGAATPLCKDTENFRGIGQVCQQNRTGLTWMTMGAKNTLPYDAAKTYCEESKMRLPTAEELNLLVNHGALDAFNVDLDEIFWTSTSSTTSEAMAAVYLPLSNKVSMAKKEVGSILCVEGANAGSFVVIPAGKFLMVWPKDEKGIDGETSSEFTIKNSFEMQTTEVTQGHWLNVMGNNPSAFSEKRYCSTDFKVINGVPLCPNNPVETVTADIDEYLTRLNARNDGYDYRLPTELEWEYAAHAGGNGSVPLDMNQIAWHETNANGQTHPVATLTANAWGLYDMFGNVVELVSEVYRSFDMSPRYSVFHHVNTEQWLRCSSWLTDSCWSTMRHWPDPHYETNSHTGFRVVRTRHFKF